MPKRILPVEDTHSDRHRLGEFIRARIKDLRLTRRDAAEGAGISEGYLCNLIAGGVGLPDRTILHRLADALQVSTAELLRVAGYLRDGDLEKFPWAYAAHADDLSEEIMAYGAQLAATSPAFRPLMRAALSELAASLQRLQRQVAAEHVTAEQIQQHAYQIALRQLEEHARAADDEEATVEANA